MSARHRKEETKYLGRSADALLEDHARAAALPNRKEGAGHTRAIYAAKGRHDPTADWVTVPLAAEPPGKANAVVKRLERTFGRDRARAMLGYTVDSAESKVAARHMRARLTRLVTNIGDWERGADRIMREEWRAWTRRQAQCIVDVQRTQDVPAWRAAGIVAAQVIGSWEAGGILPRGKLFPGELQRALHDATRDDRKAIAAPPVSAAERMRRLHPRVPDAARSEGMRNVVRSVLRDGQRIE
jgi:hypothetical protein